jgi:hypothetical protein
MQSSTNSLVDLIPFYGKKVIYFVFFLLISGCVQTTDSSLLTTVSLVSGEQTIIISSPPRFCVDQKLANKRSGLITLFIIDCVKVNGPNGIKVTRRPLSAILTATVVDDNRFSRSSISELEEIFTKKPGINYLSKSNTTAMLKVRQVERDENLLLFLIEQRIPNIGVKQSNYFWRSFFFIKGKLIIMTASNFSDERSSQLKLKRLILEFVDKTVTVNDSQVPVGAAK